MAGKMLDKQKSEIMNPTRPGAGTKARQVLRVRKSSFSKRMRTFLLDYKSINTTNWLDKLAEVYGNFAVLYLDTPMNYSFMSTDRLGYQDIVEFINRAGAALKKLGVEKGDRVILVTSNRVELGLLNFACHKIQAVPVPVNYMYREQEIKQIIQDSGAETLIADREVFAQSIRDPNHFPGLRRCLLLEEESAPPGCLSLGKLMAEAPPHLDPVPGKNPKDIVQIFYSSGTTGFPKGAQLTRLGFFYLLRTLLALSALVPGKRRDLLVTSLPLAHMMGMALFIIRLAGSIPWFFINRFDPEYILRMIQEKKATSFIGVPAMFSMLLAHHPEKYNLSSIVVWGSAADAMPPELREKIKKLRKPAYLIFPLFLEVYGQVETTGITALRLTTAREKPKPRSRFVRAPGVKIRVVDENGNPVPPGKPGELEVKSPLVTAGYWNRPEANQKAFNDGWFRTGDLVVKRRIGFEFAGRKSDRIKCGGYSVFPQEVEAELLLHPAIQQAAVVGIPDPVKGQVPAAALVLNPETPASEEELLQWTKENIAGFKRPRKLIILPELPRGATQKVLKKELVKLFEKEVDQNRAEHENQAREKR